MSKENLLATFSTEELQAELCRRLSSDGLPPITFDTVPLINRNYYFVIFDDEYGSFNFSLVHKRFWYYHYSIDSNQIAEELVLPPDAEEDSENTWEFPLSVTKEEARAQLKALGFEEITSEKYVWSIIYLYEIFGADKPPITVAVNCPNEGVGALFMKSDYTIKNHGPYCSLSEMEQMIGDWAKENGLVFGFILDCYGSYNEAYLMEKDLFDSLPQFPKENTE